MRSINLKSILLISLGIIVTIASHSLIRASDPFTLRADREGMNYFYRHPLINSHVSAPACNLSINGIGIISIASLFSLISVLDLIIYYKSHAEISSCSLWTKNNNASFPLWGSLTIGTASILVLGIAAVSYLEELFNKYRNFPVKVSEP